MIWRRHAALLCLVAAVQCGDAMPVVAAGGPGEERPLRWLQRYIQAGPDEAAAAGVVAGILHAHGISTELHVSAGRRVNLVARIDGSDPAAGPLLLLHHLDVVAPGPGWTVAPFAGLLQDGAVWGRGAIDDRSLGIAHLAAFLALAERPTPPRRDVVLLATADEESGGRLGSAWLLENRPQLFPEGTVVLTEGGTNRVLASGVHWWGVEVAQKRPLWLRMTATGRGGHGSRLDLHSAPHRLVRGLAGVLERPLEPRLDPVVLDYLRATAPYESRSFQRLLARLEELHERGELLRALRPGLPDHFLDTVQVTMLDAGTAANATPRSAAAALDVRLLPGTDQERFLEELREAAGGEVRLEVVLSSPPSPPSPTDTDLFRCLEDQLGATAPVIPSFITAVTDARHFRQRGIPAYGLSPFALTGPQMRGIHGVDERIPRREFLAGVDRMIDLVLTCAG